MNKPNPYESPATEPESSERPEPEPFRIGSPGRVALVTSAGGALGAILGRLIAGVPGTALPLLYGVSGALVATASYAIFFRPPTDTSE